MAETTPRVRYHLLDTGYCLVSEHHVLQGGERRRIACHALVALLEHPAHGWLLWDAGYAPRVLTAARGWPFVLYRLSLPMVVPAELAAVNQLARLGLRPADIRRVIISHFHADHVAGLRDFPTAELIATRAAYAGIANRRGMSALRRGHLPALLPDNIGARLRLLPEPAGEPLPALGPTLDFFGDGSLRLVALPGHARGQVGLLAQTERGPVLFAADGSWHSRAIRERRPPHRLIDLIVDDPTATRQTLFRLHDYARAQPDVLIVPTHCPEVFAREFGP